MRLSNLEQLRMPAQVSSVPKASFDRCECSATADYCEDCWTHVQFSDVCMPCGEYVAWTPVRTDKKTAKAYYRCELGHEWSCSWGELGSDDAPDVRILSQWIWDADELLEAGLPELETLPLLGHYGYIGKGFANLLAAYPKTGKTTLILHAIEEWLRLGISVRYFTEEPLMLWQPRLSLLRESVGPLKGRLTLIGGMGKPRADLMDAAYATTEDVIVLDTIRSHLGFEDENSNSEVQQKITPWIVASREIGATFIAMHHSRKSGGSHGMGIAGASALFGAVDQAVELNMHPSDAKARAVSGIGRLGNPDGFNYRMVNDKLTADPWKAVAGDQTLKQILAQELKSGTLVGADAYAKQHGYSQTLVRETYKSLGIKYNNVSKRWEQ